MEITRLLLCIAATLVLSFNAVASPTDALAVWNMQNPKDTAGMNSVLYPSGEAATGVQVKALHRNSNGFVAELAGGVLNASLGANEELCLTGNRLTFSVRAKARDGNWKGTLFSRWSDDKCFRLFLTEKTDTKPGSLVFELYSGQDEQPIRVEAELERRKVDFNSINRIISTTTPSARPLTDEWHVFIVRMNGRKIELFVDGDRIAWQPFYGVVADSWKAPFVIGGMLEKDTPSEVFVGQIDEAVVWERAIADDEVAELCSGKVDIAGEDQRRAIYQRMIDEWKREPARNVQLYRQQYHYSPIKGFMNDGNGLAYFNGYYHLMFQHWSWGHAVSKDLIHWEHRIPSLLFDDFGGCWSGSGLVDHKDRSGLFNGKSGYVLCYTYKDYYERQDGFQMQALAYSKDGFHFTKYANNPVVPKLKGIPGIKDYSGFRDAKVFWHEPTSRFVMVACGDGALFFVSANLIDWEFVALMPGLKAECPDLFELPVDDDPLNTRWVFNGAGSWSVLGRFDGREFKVEGRKQRVFYGTDGYASQTWANEPKGRRIMTTWLFNWANVFSGQTWPTQKLYGSSGGSMTIPVELKLKSTDNGIRLTQTPVEELKQLRAKTHSFTDVTISGASTLLNAIQTPLLEIEADIELGTAKKVGFDLLKGLDEKTRVVYDVAAEKLLIDRSNAGFDRIRPLRRNGHAPLPSVHGKLDLHIFTDSGSVEVFADGGLVAAYSVVLPSPTSDRISVFTEGGEAKLSKLQVHELKSIWRSDAEEHGQTALKLLMHAEKDAYMHRDNYLGARVWPKNAANRKLKWTSHTPEILEARSVDAEHVYLDLKQCGIAVVTASTADGKLEAQCTVKVQDMRGFKTNMNNWMRIGGGWIVTERGAELNGGIIGCDGGFKSGTLETDVEFTDGGNSYMNPIIWTDGKAGKRGLSICLDLKKQRLYFDEWAKRRVTAEVPCKIAIGKKYRLKVVFDEKANVSVFLDGEKKLEGNFAEIARGASVALRGNNAIVSRAEIK